RLASLIESKEVVIPSILNEVNDEDVSLSVETYFEGKRNSFKDINLLQASYHKVFKFMLELYLNNPIELQHLSESKFLNHDFVEEFISNQDQGQEVILIYRNLFL